jgi:hypothetical protein
MLISVLSYNLCRNFCYSFSSNCAFVTHVTNQLKDIFIWDYVRFYDFQMLDCFSRNIASRTFRIDIGVLKNLLRTCEF